MDYRTAKYYIEQMKKTAAALKTDPSVKGFVSEIKDMLDKILEGKPEEITAKLTKWDDVNETLMLAQKGEELQKNYNARTQALDMLKTLMSLAAAFAPALSEAAAVVKAAKKGKK